MEISRVKNLAAGTGIQTCDLLTQLFFIVAVSSVQA